MVERQLANDTCPVCGSTSIEGWEVIIEGNLAIQECTCGECGCSCYFRVFERLTSALPKPAKNEIFLKVLRALICFSNSDPSSSSVKL